jgi:hypothetical protein
MASRFQNPTPVQIGAAVSDLGSLTFTSNQTGGTTTITAKGSRVGDTLNAYVRMVQTGSNGTLATFIAFTMPTGYTIDTTRLNSDNFVGLATQDTGAGTFNPAASIIAGSSTTLIVRKQGTAGNLLGTDMTVNAELHLNLRIPIAEWAGSGTVNLGAGAQVEYVYNNSATTATDTTSFAYGPAGFGLQSFAPSGNTPVSKRCRFQNAPQIGDVIELQVSTTAGQWFKFTERLGGYSENDAGNTSYGFLLVRQSATDFDINFYSRPFPSLAWSSLTSVNWRLAKYNPSSPVGFGKADSSSSGLVNPRKGQYQMTVTSSLAGWSTASGRTSGIYYQDQDGNHRLKFNITGVVTPVTSTGGVWTLSGVTFKSGSDNFQAVNCFNAQVASQPIARADPSASTITVAHPSTAGCTRYCLSGDVELESKPSWA